MRYLFLFSLLLSISLYGSLPPGQLSGTAVVADISSGEEDDCCDEDDNETGEVDEDIIIDEEESNDDEGVNN